MASIRYQPPAVRYPVPGLRWPLRLGAALWALEGGLLLAWQLWAGPLGWAVVALGWAQWIAVGGIWWRSAGRMPQGLLQWDGGAWWWWPQNGAEPQPLQAMQVRLDLQTAMWVAWQGMDGAWQSGWLQASSDGACWGDWRRAVYSAATVSPLREERV